MENGPCRNFENLPQARSSKAKLDLEVREAQLEIAANEIREKSHEVEAANLEAVCAKLASQLEESNLEGSELRKAVEEKLRPKIDSLKEELVESDEKLKKLEALDAAIRDLEAEAGVLRSEVASVEAEKDRLESESDQVRQTST